MSYLTALQKRIEKTRGFLVTEALDPDASPETIASVKYKCDAFKQVLDMIKDMMEVKLEDLPKELKNYAADVVLKEFPDYAKEDYPFKEEKIARFSKLVYAGADWVRQIGALEGEVYNVRNDKLGVRADLPDNTPLQPGWKVNLLIYK